MRMIKMESIIEEIYCFVKTLDMEEDYRKLAFKEMIRPALEISEELFLKEVE
jgi:hypothetical protein